MFRLDGLTVMHSLWEIRSTPAWLYTSDGRQAYESHGSSPVSAEDLRWS